MIRPSTQADSLAQAELEQFRRLGTCIVASAIETLRARLPNTGFANSSIRCMFPGRPSAVGYAATARIRSAKPPMTGEGYYYVRPDWWNNILSIPAPRIVVIEDVDQPPGTGAFIGEVNANILWALGAQALVTNGSVRDLDGIELTNFQVFAGSVAVSHAYAHVFDFGVPIELGGLKIHPGDLIQGDRHGVQTIPLEIAKKVPAMARQILRRRHHLTELCRADDFSIDRLRQAIEQPDLGS